MWKLTDKADGRDPLPGVPWRDMEDAEFRDVAKAYAALGGWPARTLHKSGYFEHVAGGEPDPEPDDEPEPDAEAATEEAS